jgi:hypothetical protein
MYIDIHTNKQNTYIYKDKDNVYICKPIYTRAVRNVTGKCVLLKNYCK